MPQSNDGAELGDAIEAVRLGLERAAAQGEGHLLRFTVESVELELAVELRRSGAAGGGVKAWVVSADARHERARTRTQRMKVTLKAAGSVPICDSTDTGSLGPDPIAGDPAFKAPQTGEDYPEGAP
ncbi:trypco2 family protein [Streptomyces sp. NPDC020362]|uniref:trypco2 family protein n=1 Tax=unclassified Streptomyces TaxID=2593676 RepID=UPI0034047AC3